MVRRTVKSMKKKKKGKKSKKDGCEKKGDEKGKVSRTERERETVDVLIVVEELHCAWIRLFTKVTYLCFLVIVCEEYCP